PKVLNWEYFHEFSSHLKTSEINGSFRVSTLFEKSDSWWSLDYVTEIPKIIGHYLKLNMTFITPTWQFNITSKTQWVEAALNLMQNQNIDYIIEPIFLS